MIGNNRSGWVYLGEIVEAVAQQGIDELEAIKALLSALSSGLSAYGYRRQYSMQGSDWVERLPRDIHPQPVPIALWRNCGAPEGNLTSYWADDPDEPGTWISVDWISGCASSFEWEITNLEAIRTEFSAIRIPRKKAVHLQSDLMGKPKKRAGRPSGPSNPWERQQIEVALRKIEAGDARPASAIAWDLVDTALTGKALESQRRRIEWGILQSRTRFTKNSPKK